MDRVKSGNCAGMVNLELMRLPPDPRIVWADTEVDLLTHEVERGQVDPCYELQLDLHSKQKQGTPAGRL